MTADIKNVIHAKGWGEYVLEKGERPGAILVTGDIELGDSILNGLDYKSGNAVHLVLSFAKEDHVDPQKGRAIALDFMKEFMYGFYSDEYHMDMVEHTDTDHLHYHVRIPKINLLTNTQLKLYYHKSDLGFKKSVIEHIAYKHHLVTGDEHKNTLPKAMESIERIETWRKEHQQKPFVLSHKKGRAEAENSISQYIAGGVKEGLIGNLDEVKKELQTLDLKVSNEGYDKGKGFHYLTVENESGKIRLKGDIYGEQFYRLSQENRAENIQSNRSFTTRAAELRKSGTDIKQTLSTECNKRLKFIDRQYGQARKRAYQTHNERHLEFDKADDRKDRDGNTKPDESIEREYDQHAQGYARRETASPAHDEKHEKRTNQDASETMDHTHLDRRSDSHRDGSRDVGSDRTPKQSTPGPSRAGANHRTDQTYTGQVRKKGMGQRSRREERTQSVARLRQWTMGRPIQQRQLKEHYDRTRTETDRKSHTDERDAQTRARTLRRKLEEDSARLRRELQESHDTRMQQRAARRDRLTNLYKTAYLAKQGDYHVIENTLSSRFSREAVAANLKGLFSEFRDKADVFKSKIDRGNRRLFEGIKKIITEIVGEGMFNTRDSKEEIEKGIQDSIKERMHPQKRQEVLKAIKEKSKEEKKEVEKEVTPRGPSIGM